MTPSGKQHLSPDELRLKESLEHYPALKGYWDFDKLSYDQKAINKDFYNLSRQDQIMVQFFVSVSLNRNALTFDLFAAVRELDEINSQVVKDWIDDPYFP